ncbi:GIY-YIG nuclease family protein [Candidatus Kaiserbacteria bacterium]|nr:MAG: GIY-YIG nuclease family protein [Candidatus Kaiserbacteria bacterium]
MEEKLDSVFVVPGYTFFYWGFTLTKNVYPNYIKHFNFGSKKLIQPIKLKVGNKFYDAKIRLTRITTDKSPNREVVQISYEQEYDTLKALRKEFIFSHASTIDKKRPKLKELFELVHLSENKFKIKPISKQETDFDDMLRFMEEKNLFQYWKDSKKDKQKSIFIDYSRKWIPAAKAQEYRNRANVIYILHNRHSKQLYVGKANIFGNRVKKGSGRIGLDADWDKFMFFEIDPEYAHQLAQIETFAIRILATVLENDVGTKPIKEHLEKLVNRQLRKNR